MIQAFRQPACRRMVAAVLLASAMADGQARDDIETAAVVVVDPDEGWSLRMPPGWREVTPTVLEQINRFAGSVSQGPPLRFTHAFTTAQDGDLTYPYALVQVVEAPLRGATLDEVESMFRSGVIQTGVRRAVTSVEGEAGSASAGEVVLHRDRGVAVFDLAVDQSSGESTRARVWMFLAADGIIQLNCYDHADSFARSLADFEVMASGFGFDPGRAFRPAGYSADRPGRRWWVVFPIVLGVIGTAAVVFGRRRLTGNAC